MDMRMSDMLNMQRELQKKHEGEWDAMEPANGKSQLLWAICEIGEVIDIIKKKGEEAIMNDPAVRASLVEEYADVLMYMGDVLLCYGISAEEISDAFIAKHDFNMRRVWDGTTHSEQKDSPSK